MKHELKCWKGPFAAIVDGRKRFEVRKFDRPFKEGDEIELKEYDEINGEYTGRVWFGIIGFVVYPGQWGLPPDLGVFSLIDPSARVLLDGEMRCVNAVCPVCNGRKTVDIPSRGLNPNYLPWVVKCSRCDGAGTVPERVE